MTERFDLGAAVTAASAAWVDGAEAYKGKDNAPYYLAWGASPVPAAMATCSPYGRKRGKRWISAR